jgi:hypothetical protein
VAFVKSGNHLKPTGEYFVDFPALYRALNARGAQFHVDAWQHDPHFSVSEGANTFGIVDRREQVIRVLDNHRKSATEGYRSLPTWIILFLTDTMEYFCNTIEAVRRDPLPIVPFVEDI